MNSKTNYDVIVIGAGPAGSAAATIIAQHGHRVLVVEREKFPRYHIGESLIPFTFQELDRLGVIPKMRASCFTKKYSVCFVQPDGQASQPFYFFNRYDKETVAQTWQVSRAEFDQMLVENAREKGAHVREQTEVADLLREGERVIGVRTKAADGSMEEIYAPLTLDCTGKEAFSSNHNGWRLPDPMLRKISIWTYYKNSKRAQGIDEGATTIAFVPQKGWFWHIPLHDNRVSVGVVAEGKYLTRDGLKDLRAIFDREIEQNAWIKEHLSTGKCEGEYWITSEFSRHSRFCAAPGLVLAGDALAFLDPCFSSGILLALKSGVMVGDAIHEGILANDLSPKRFATYGATIRQGIENMRKLVYAFYTPEFSFKDIVMRYPDAAGSITDCLSGDVNKDFSKLWSQIREVVPLPDDLPYGEPMPATGR